MVIKKAEVKKILCGKLKDKGYRSQEIKWAFKQRYPFEMMYKDDLDLTQEWIEIVLESLCFVIDHQMDVHLVGTDFYRGHAYFWACKYKYDLRETTPNIRRKIHQEFLDNKLALEGETQKHDKIVNKHFASKEHRAKMEQVYGKGAVANYTQEVA